MYKRFADIATYSGITMGEIGYCPYFSDHGTVLTFRCEHERDRYFAGIVQRAEYDAITAVAEHLTGDARTVAELMAGRLTVPDDKWSCDCDQWKIGQQRRDETLARRLESIAAEHEAKDVA